GMKNNVDTQMTSIIICVCLIKLTLYHWIGQTCSHIASSVIIKLLFKRHMPFISLASGDLKRRFFFSHAIFPTHGERS
ncbi:hypothetical protein, partial [Vibrio harveyi]|uniref:hypothetical protein n=1 Tax=Vibrio harveyi TaxID=669 RepID=UPI003BB6E33D